MLGNYTVIGGLTSFNLSQASILTPRSLSSFRVVYRAGRLPWWPACLVRPIDLYAHPIKVKQALIDPHGKSDLPYPRWLPPGPLHHCTSRHRHVARCGCNGEYKMSGLDPRGDNGKAGVDRKDKQVRTLMTRTDMEARTFRAGTGMWV